MDSPDSYAKTTAVNQLVLPSTMRRRVSTLDVPQDVDDHFIMEHLNDPNLDLENPNGRFADKELPDNRQDLELGLSTNATETTYASSRSSTSDFDDESPYPEVRLAVSKTDDPHMPVNTFRMWFLGIFFSVLLAGLNQIFEYRDPSVFITGLVGNIVSLAAGKLLEWCLPTKRFKLPFGYEWCMNPCPFNVKEHVCIGIMISVAYNGAIATDVLATQREFFGQHLSGIYQLLLILGTQTFGFALGGLLRQFVVWPASMIWPSALVNSAMFNTLHSTWGKRDRGHMTRLRFFSYACLGSFAWYWVPGYLFTGLSMFTWVCWVSPNNLVVNSLFGGSSGLGMSVVTLDWSMITLLGSPLTSPWWSSMNVIASFVFCFWIITPVIYFTNTFFTGFLPLSSFQVFDNTGAPYNISATIVDGVFNQTAYEAYSPVFLTSSMCVGYFVAFAFFTSLFTHTMIWYGRDIIRRTHSNLKLERDVHARLMSVYPEAPQWWFAVLGAISILFIFIAIGLSPDAGLPVWAAILAILVATSVSLPLAIISAKTNQTVGLNVVEELLGGLVVPDRPVANMIFKTICLAGTQQAIAYSGDLKLGHYQKIPPRLTFAIQTVSVVITCFVVTAVNSYMLSNVPDICTGNAPDGFVCPSTHVFADAALIWGGIGPRALFGRGSIYRNLLWGFPIGLFAPIPFWLLARRYPLSNWRYVNIPLFCGGVAAIPAAAPYNYAAWGLTAFIFAYYIRRTHFRWWMRYVYILSAALDSGLALSTVVMFFVVVFPKGGFTLNWIGNTVWQNTADSLGLPLLTPQNGTFGPSSW
ncbi:OPT oligopeptide transporter [Mycena chlorophos]|uniref:OPT oligopeptide transporter n=1 Tax=Mycena chlorophos TaxID=658473 RepID=A0A8H6WEB1_MYCCL|nr:OPT oligopeptide transporter [Mycena chlorophos]